MKLTTFTKSGNKGSELTLDKAIFEVETNEQLLQLAYNRYLNNARTNNAKTLTRAQVRGGGRKPWRQKGTGRARTGSIRNPLWRTGGIIFGPTGQENYTQVMPKQMARASLRQALSAQAKHIIVVEKFEQADYKTKTMVDLLSKLNATGNVLLVADDFTETFRASSANIAGVVSLKTKSLSVFAILNADTIVIERPALESISAWLNAPRVAKTTSKVDVKREKVDPKASSRSSKVKVSK